MTNYQLHHGDCLDVMAGMVAESVDCVVTDPPYGIAISRNSNKFGVATDRSRKASSHTWDDTIPGAEVFSEMFRVSMDQIIFGFNYFMEYLHSSPCYIVWDKRGSMPYVPFTPTEIAWTSFDRMPKKYTVVNHGFIKDSPEDRTVHPTQKPLLLMEHIVRDFTRPGDTILDPFMGSGTTGVACGHLGRRFVGIELDEGYFKIAEKRIRDAYAMGAGEFRALDGGGDMVGLPLFDEFGEGGE